MKYTLSILIASFSLLAAIPDMHAEELQDFLKRTTIGNATTNDVHENFHGTVFFIGPAIKTDRDSLLRFWQAQKASGIKLAVDNCKIVSRTETPNDGKGSVISVVAKVSVTEEGPDSILKTESTSHFIILRDSSGAFRLLYGTVLKQVRNA